LRVSVTVGAVPAPFALTVPAWHPSGTAPPPVTATADGPIAGKAGPASLVVLLLVGGLAVAHAAVGSAATLAAESRQQAHLGVSHGELMRSQLAGTGVPALAAGLMSALLAGPVAELSHVAQPGVRSWAAVPIALVIGLVPASVPAWWAGSAAHSERTVGEPGARWHARGRLRAPLVQLWSTPVRSALCLAVVALACGYLTACAPSWVVIACLATTVALTFVDAGWLAAVDRAGEWGELRTQGLLALEVAGLVIREMAVLVVGGALVGCAVGLAVAAAIDSTGMS
jgi:putative ABC transport system permease protein